jgi:hypothetical protein
MLIQYSPIALNSPQDADMKERFFYWQGASGQKYIHSVYELDSCPPLPGAIYVAVKRQGPLRIAVSVGRFAPFWDKTLGGDEFAKLEILGVDEVHVHLLAHNPDCAETIRSDLAAALGESPHHFGFNEATSSVLYAA